MLHDVRMFCAAAVLVIGMPASSALAAQAPAGPPPQPLYLLVYERGPAWIEGKPIHEQKLGEHVVYIRGLIDNGKVVAGGPFGDESGGMAIVRAESLAEAEAMLAADPALTNGTFKGRVRQWTPFLDSGRPLRQ